MPLTRSTAGNAKARYLSGKTKSDHQLTQTQLDKLHDELLEYANNMENENQHGYAQKLKACLAQRKAELEVKNITKKAGLVQEGCGAAHEEALVIAGLAKELAKMATKHTNTTKKAGKHAEELHTSADRASHSVTDAGTASSSALNNVQDSLDKNRKITEQNLEDYEKLANDVLKQDREQEVTNLQVDILEDLVEDSKDEVLQQDVKIEVLEERLKKSDENIKALEEELKQSLKRQVTATRITQACPWIS